MVAAVALLASIGGGWWLITRDSSTVAGPSDAPAGLTVDDRPETTGDPLASIDTTAAVDTEAAPATDPPLETDPPAATQTVAAATADSVTTDTEAVEPDEARTTSFEVERLRRPKQDLQPGVPAVDAAAYLVYDAATNRIIAAKEASTPRAVGSVIKLLTTLVVLQAGPLEDPVTVPKMTIDAKESQIGLRAGEKLTRAILMRAMLIVSANDAARALAIDTAGSEEKFVEQMNAMAEALGLQDTVAKSPVGLDAPGAHSTAEDVLTLARHVLRNDDVRAAVARRTAKLHGTTYAATNKLIGSLAGADGIKTGRTTQAGYCIAASATRNGRQIIVVVLGAPSDAARTKAAKALINWGFTT